MEPANDSAAVRAAAAAAVAPDPLTAQILAKHSAGESLTPQESGKMGAWRAKLNRLWAGKGGAAGPAPGPIAGASGNASAVASVASGQTPPDRMEPVPFDPASAQRLAGILIEGLDAVKVGVITKEARKSGAVGQMLDRFRSAAAFSKDSRKLLVELSPDVCEELNINPRRFAVWTALGVVGMHVTELGLLVAELREMRKDKPLEPLTPKAAALKDGQALVPPKERTPGVV